MISRLIYKTTRCDQLNPVTGGPAAEMALANNLKPRRTKPTWAFLAEWKALSKVSPVSVASLVELLQKNMSKRSPAQWLGLRTNPCSEIIPGRTSSVTSPRWLFVQPDRGNTSRQSSCWSWGLCRAAIHTSFRPDGKQTPLKSVY